MGTVVLAHDTQLNRQVAVKALRVGDAGTDDQRKRFEVEGRALAMLKHPHVVAVHELLRDGGALFLVMECVEGESLAERLEGGALEAREAARVTQAVAEALACAHGHGVLHRDVKPGNVLLSKTGGVVLVDFGLAKRIDSSVALTRTGQFMGTPAYLAPEQAVDARTVDARTDVYSLGATLFHMLTGDVVFPAEGLIELISQLTGRAAPDPRQFAPEVPKDLAAICLRCLEKTPADRYPDAEALAVDLRAFLAGGPLRVAAPAAHARRVTLALLAVAVLLMATVAGLLATRSAEGPPAGATSDPAETSVLKGVPDPAQGPVPEGSGARPEKQTLAHDDCIDMCFVPGRSDLVVSASPKSVRMWSLGTEIQRLWESELPGVTWVAVSPDGRTVACGRTRSVHLLSTEDGRERATIALETRPNIGLWRDDSELLLGCEAPVGLLRVRASDGTPLPSKRLNYPIHCLAVDPVSGTVAWGGGELDEGELKRIDLSRGALGPSAQSSEGWLLSGSPRCVTSTRKAGEWVVGLSNGVMHVLQAGQVRPDDTARAETLLVAPSESFSKQLRNFLPQVAHRSRVAGVGVLADGLIVSCMGRRGGGDLRVWDLNREQPLVGLAIPGGIVLRRIEVSSDGQWVGLATREPGVIVLSADFVLAEAKRHGTQLPE
jgi:predicted Ser/Thr protein kinase